MLLLVLAVYTVGIILDFRISWLSNRPGIKWPCLFLYGFGIVIQALYVLNINVPSPAPLITNFIASLFNIQ